jgi:uncharacterized protein (TIGR02118 family)
MVKLIFCLRRLPGLSRDEFQTYWKESHGPLVRSVASTLGIVRYVQSHTLDNPDLAAVLAARGVDHQPYDGVAELWWNNVEELLAAGSTEQGREAARTLYEDEQRFIDHAKSELTFVNELEMVPGQFGTSH